MDACNFLSVRRRMGATKAPRDQAEPLDDRDDLAALRAALTPPTAEEIAEFNRIVFRRRAP